MSPWKTEDYCTLVQVSIITACKFNLVRKEKRLPGLKIRIFQGLGLQGVKRFPLSQSALWSCRQLVAPVIGTSRDSFCLFRLSLTSTQQSPPGPSQLFCTDVLKSWMVPPTHILYSKCGKPPSCWAFFNFQLTQSYTIYWNNRFCFF